MSTPQQANERNLSRILHCPRCHTQLPLYAAFCSSCGEQVEKNGETAPSIPVPDIDAKKLGTVPSSQHMKQWISRPLSAVSYMPQPKATSNPSESNWLWPTIIILSAVAAGLVNFAFTDIALRPIVVFWFLFVCPGMVLVRFLRLNEPIVEWTLALALSFAIDAIVAGILLYTGRWLPTGILSILIGLSLCGAIVQLATSTIFVPKLLHAVRLRKPSEWDLIG